MPLAVARMPHTESPTWSSTSKNARRSRPTCDYPSRRLSSISKSWNRRWIEPRPKIGAWRPLRERFLTLSLCPCPLFFNHWVFLRLPGATQQSFVSQLTLSRFRVSFCFFWFQSQNGEESCLSSNKGNLRSTHDHSFCQVCDGGR